MLEKRIVAMKKGEMMMIVCFFFSGEETSNFEKAVESDSNLEEHVESDSDSDMFWARNKRRRVGV
jgi:hypothetical protein